MGRTIQYCISNVSAADRERYLECESSVREERCLQRCGRCAREPFAVVDGVVVQLGHEAVSEQFGGE